ncbi:hypothetical protein BH23BAC4_BH23BAC4_17840 [soil metagenome]
MRSRRRRGLIRQLGGGERRLRFRRRVCSLVERKLHKRIWTAERLVRLDLSISNLTEAAPFRAAAAILAMDEQTSK